LQLVPLTLTPKLGNQLPMRPARLNAASTVVVFGGHPQVGVTEQVTRDANLVRGCQSPCRCCSIARAPVRRALGLQSAYHFMRGVEQGHEKEPTIYWRDRKKDGPQYHINYCFLPSAWANSIASFRIEPLENWVASKLSDHVPLLVDVDVQKP
jgi:hypothetical protein